MKIYKYAIALLVLLSAIIVSCDLTNENSNTERVFGDKTGSAVSAIDENEIPDFLTGNEKITLEGNEIEFVGREVKESGDDLKTVFKYTVTNDGTTSQSNKFSLELPACAGDLVAHTPSTNTKTSDEITWNNAIPNEGSRSFSISFAGNVPFGIITASLVQGSTELDGQIIGPCAGVYTLSGSIFIEGLKSDINNVKITLADSDDNERDTKTVNGNYSFRVIPGTYTVSAEESFLNGTYNLVTENNVEKTVTNEDISNVNFGYTLDSNKAVSNLTSSDLIIDTEPTKFWVDQIRHAGRNNSRSDFTLEELEELLKAIEGFQLPEPFQFDPNNRQRSALDILTRPIKTELDEFLQQLLTAQLNVFSQRGAYTVENGITVLDEDFNYSLMIYGESLGCAAMKEAGLVVSCEIPDNSTTSDLVISNTVFSNLVVGTNTAGTMSNSTLSDGTMVLSAFNGTGGIGTN